MEIFPAGSSKDFVEIQVPGWLGVVVHVEPQDPGVGVAPGRSPQVTRVVSDGGGWPPNGACAELIRKSCSPSGRPVRSTRTSIRSEDATVRAWSLPSRQPRHSRPPPVDHRPQRQPWPQPAIDERQRAEGLGFGS